MKQKRLCDCVADEIIRFGDGTGPKHSIMSTDKAKRTMLICGMDEINNCTEQTIPIDDETLVWARS